MNFKQKNQPKDLQDVNTFSRSNFGTKSTSSGIKPDLKLLK